jgi:hypothetical protein
LVGSSVVGPTTGARVGFTEGVSVGGEVDGLEDGPNVGDTLGTPDGAELGALVGFRLFTPTTTTFENLLERPSWSINGLPFELSTSVIIVINAKIRSSPLRKSLRFNTIR